MLDYSKLILEKVSFDPLLFKKELKKFKQWLSASERKALIKWCLEKYPSHLIY
jgi:hypothetical protein